jgi:hypothetical protein
MLHRGTLVKLATLALLVAGLWIVTGSEQAGRALHAALQEKKEGKDAKKDGKRSGTVVGQVTKKGENFIEVKADGEERARRYVPHWLAGGFDKKMLKTFRELKIGTRIRLEWEFDERARAVRIEALRKPDSEKK